MFSPHEFSRRAPRYGLWLNHVRDRWCDCGRTERHELADLLGKLGLVVSQDHRACHRKVAKGCSMHSSLDHLAT